MLGNDQVKTLAERLLHGISKQRAGGSIPANDRSGAARVDHRIRRLIDNPVRQV